MRLSIIIPAYNAESFLPQCLESILSQHGDFEVIVVNDGSADGTASLLENYARRWPSLKFITQKNQGMSTARNEGIKAAEGDYVMFVDSDDWLVEDSLPIVIHALKDEDVLCFNAQKYIEKTGEYLEKKLPEIKETLSGWDYFNKQRLVPTEIHFVCVWQRAYKRTFLLDNNLFFAEGILRAEDDLFTTMVMYYAQTLRVIPDVVYVYRVRDNSITTTVNVNRWYDSLKVQEMLVDFFKDKDQIDKTAINRVLSSNYIGWFGADNIKKYGNHDKELLVHVDWDVFKQMAVAKRHKRLYRLIRFSPKAYRLYERLVKLL